VFLLLEKRAIKKLKRIILTLKPNMYFDKMNSGFEYTFKKKSNSIEMLPKTTA
jgi:hypothetical protein